MQESKNIWVLTRKIKFFLNNLVNIYQQKKKFYSKTKLYFNVIYTIISLIFDKSNECSTLTKVEIIIFNR